MWWTNEKILHQKQYFESQRKEPTGIFTELVVRTYYYIYKCCEQNRNTHCPSSDISRYKILRFIFEEFDDTQTYVASTIDDCIKKLKLMHYIRFVKENDKWIVYIVKPLDFLLEGEHEAYMDKLQIKNKIDFNNE